jgi:hypothetical protein
MTCNENLIQIKEGTSLHDVGFVTFLLSREWMAKVLFTMINYIIQGINDRLTQYEHVC